MNGRTFDAGVACIDFFICGMSCADGDIIEAIVFGILGLILYLCAVWPD